MALSVTAAKAREKDEKYIGTLGHIDAALLDHVDQWVFGPPQPDSAPAPKAHDEIGFFRFSEIGMSITGRVESTAYYLVVRTAPAPGKGVYVPIPAGLKQALQEADVHTGHWVTITRVPSAPGSRRWEFTVEFPAPPAWAAAS